MIIRTQGGVMRKMLLLLFSFLMNSTFSMGRICQNIEVAIQNKPDGAKLIQECQNVESRSHLDSISERLCEAVSRDRYLTSQYYKFGVETTIKCMQQVDGVNFPYSVQRLMEITFSVADMPTISHVIDYGFPLLRYGYFNDEIIRACEGFAYDIPSSTDNCLSLARRYERSYLQREALNICEEIQSFERTINIKPFEKCIQTISVRNYTYRELRICRSKVSNRNAQFCLENPDLYTGRRR